MREIKFRAWTGESMTDVIRLESAHGIRLVSSSDLAPHEMSDDKVVFMQYTGLKDKNGKEICEGDIVKYENLNMDVCWRNYGWHLFYRKLGEVGYLVPPYGGSVDGYKHMEIIGNIYENPELIK